jgi:hypothetical protein
VDEPGYMPYSPDGAALLFHWISRGYERISLVVTTNRFANFPLATGRINQSGAIDIESRDSRVPRRPMNDTSQYPSLPDRLSVNPRSPHYVAAVFEHDIGIRLNDKERKDVEEYCISEGWVKVPAGKTVDRKGQPLLIKLQGKVEVFYR